MEAVQADEQKYAIYRLIDPRDDSTRYVGRSSHIFQRYAQHILSFSAKKKGARYDWIKSLKKQNLVPTLDVLETGIENRYQAVEREAYWIRYYRSLGADLTNVLEPRRVHASAPGGLHNRRLTMPATNLRHIRENLGASQEGVARRTRSIGLRTYIRAESGCRVTYATASQILEAINALLTLAGRPTVILDDLGLTLY